MFLLSAFPFYAFAASGEAGPDEAPTPASVAVEWVQGAFPSPAIGDEYALLALLRGGGSSEAGGQYAAALAAHLQSGAAETQPLEDCAWQVLALAATGASAEEAAPFLLQRLATPDNLLVAGPNAMRLALLVFGAAGQPIPSASLDFNALLVSLVESADEEGGFGSAEGADILTTARVLQVLALYRSHLVVDASIENALGWLKARQSAYGGFDNEAGPDLEATAEVVLALASLGVSTLREDSPAPADALLQFQNDDGSFSTDPDNPAEPRLAALASLALVAHQRHLDGRAQVFNMDETAAGAMAPLAIPSASFGTGNQPTSLPVVNIPGLAAFPLPVVIAGSVILLGVLVLLILLVVGAGRRKKKRAQAKSEEDERNAPPSIQKGIAIPTRVTASPARPTPAAESQPSPPIAQAPAVQHAAQTAQAQTQPAEPVPVAQPQPVHQAAPVQAVPTQPRAASVTQPIPVAPPAPAAPVPSTPAPPQPVQAQTQPPQQQAPPVQPAQPPAPQAQPPRHTGVSRPVFSIPTPLPKQQPEEPAREEPVIPQPRKVPYSSKPTDERSARRRKNMKL